MINFKFVRFTLVVYVSHKVNVLVTDIILNIISREHLIFISLHIGSRLFELLSKEVRVKKQLGMPLNYTGLVKSSEYALSNFPNVMHRKARMFVQSLAN